MDAKQKREIRSRQCYILNQYLHFLDLCLSKPRQTLWTVWRNSLSAAADCSWEWGRGPSWGGDLSWVAPPWPALWRWCQGTTRQPWRHKLQHNRFIFDSLILILSTDLIVWSLLAPSRRASPRMCSSCWWCWSAGPPPRSPRAWRPPCHWATHWPPANILVIGHKLK